MNVTDVFVLWRSKPLLGGPRGAGKTAIGKDIAEVCNLKLLLSEEVFIDEELADLLEKGHTEEIRAALPGMSPDTKKLVNVMLAEKGQ